MPVLPSGVRPSVDAPDKMAQQMLRLTRVPARRKWQKAMQLRIGPIGERIVGVDNPDDLEATFGECASDDLGEPQVNIAAEAPPRVDHKQPRRTCAGFSRLLALGWQKTVHRDSPRRNPPIHLFGQFGSAFRVEP